MSSSFSIKPPSCRQVVTPLASSAPVAVSRLKKQINASSDALASYAPVKGNTNPSCFRRFIDWLCRVFRWLFCCSNKEEKGPEKLPIPEIVLSHCKQERFGSQVLATLAALAFAVSEEDANPEMLDHIFQGTLQTQNVNILILRGKIRGLLRDPRVQNVLGEHPDLGTLAARLSPWNLAAFVNDPRIKLLLNAEKARNGAPIEEGDLPDYPLNINDNQKGLERAIGCVPAKAPEQEEIPKGLKRDLGISTNQYAFFRRNTADFAHCLQRFSDFDETRGALLITAGASFGIRKTKDGFELLGSHVETEFLKRKGWIKESGQAAFIIHFKTCEEIARFIDELHPVQRGDERSERVDMHWYR